jgi:hypothetical protein
MVASTKVVGSAEWYSALLLLPLSVLELVPESVLAVVAGAAVPPQATNTKLAMTRRLNKVNSLRIYLLLFHFCFIVVMLETKYRLLEVSTSFRY